MLRTVLARYFKTSAPKFAKSTKEKKKPEKAKKVGEEAPVVEPMPTSPEEILAFKKDFKKSFPASYDPQFVETYWAEWWEKSQFYHTKPEEAANIPHDKKFLMILPPPNVTGSLHLGHALTGAVEDCLARWRRMQGFKTVYLPGVDHAGIATQAIVEKNLRKEGVSKYDLGREKFVEKVWEWKHSYGTRIEKQLRRLGSSLDWDRMSFTMDEPRSRAVIEAFCRLHEKGLIYRSNRLVNWSCNLKTAISDIEVDMLEVSGPQKYNVPSDKVPAEIGVLVEFAYKVKDSNEEIVVATTRLETMLGDVAVAVNSQDPRYKHLHGKELVHPFIPERKMKIITDDVLVDMNFGTGAVKITPAHDPNDFECGKRHNLEFINILTDSGEMNENAGPYKGIGRYQTRKMIEKDMEKMGILKGKKPNPMVLSICSRSGDIIEPLIKPQWYVECKDIAQKMIKVVEDGELKIVPEMHTKIWNHWLKNIQDWCISRQLWWGHQVPAYKAKIVGQSESYINESDGSLKWFVGRNTEEVKKAVEAKHPGVQFELEQDEDVLDTWFSSALLPFSNFGWPNEADPNFTSFFPNTTLETGYDILFFWVARMVMMSLLLTDKLPFQNVLLHNLVRDENREKMSKSKGNVIDPLEIMDGCSLDALVAKIRESLLPESEKEKSINQKKKSFPEGFPKCGSDALRFSLLSYVTENKDINYDVKTTIAYRAFGNKIWNAYKLTRMLLGDDYKPNFDVSEFASYEEPEKWILSQFNEAVKEVNQGFENFKFADATEAFNGFWMNNFCDFYIEYAKTVDKTNEKLFAQTQNTLFFVLENSLRLLHPMMPFLTEELYQKLPDFEGKSQTISLVAYPKSETLFESFKTNFSTIIKTIQSIRQLSGIFTLPPKSFPPIFLTFDQEDKATADFLAKYFNYIKAQCKSGDIMIVGKSEVPKQCLQGLCVLNLTAHLYLKDSIKVSEEAFKIKKKIQEVEKFIQRLQDKIKKPDYETKVPAEVRKQETESLETYNAQMEKLKQTLQIVEQLE